MSGLIKLVVYLGLLAGVGFCGSRFGAEFEAVTAVPSSGSRSAMMAWFGGTLGLLVILGLMTAREVGAWLGRRTESHILEGEKPDAVPNEVRQAELLVKQKQPLEAIRVLREFLQAHPKEFYVQFQIAEIYAGPLRNNLAAALEYEDLLGKKLDPERWGWTAIRLVRLYAKLGRQEEVIALLERVVRDYGKTSAARKAEKLLAGRENPAA